LLSIFSSIRALLRFGAALFGEQKILFAVCLFDVVVEAAQRVLETVGLLLVGLPRQLHLLAARDVLGAAHERLLGELVLILLHRQHRSPLPILGFLQLLAGLILEALLVGDRGSNLLFGPNELRAHVENDLVQHLLGLLEFRDHRVDVGPKQHRDPIEDIHGSLD
jgi:hypothetical protein